MSELVIRIPLIDGGGFQSWDHDRIQKALRAVLEHMEQAGIDSPGGVRSPHGGEVARWTIEEGAA